IDATMQIDDLAAARALMQAIDILRNHAFDAPRVLEAREGVVRFARQHSAELTPTDCPPRPITLPCCEAADELLIGHGRLSLPGALAVTVVRNARLGAAPRTGQYHQVPAALKQLSECLEFQGRGHSPFCHRD